MSVTRLFAARSHDPVQRCRLDLREISTRTSRLLCGEKGSPLLDARMIPQLFSLCQMFLQGFFEVFFGFRSTFLRRRKTACFDDFRKYNCLFILPISKKIESNGLYRKAAAFQPVDGERKPFSHGRELRIVFRLIVRLGGDEAQPVRAVFEDVHGKRNACLTVCRSQKEGIFYGNAVVLLRMPKKGWSRLL